MKPLLRVVCIFGLAAASLLAAQESALATKPSPLQPLAFLIGDWTGSSDGQPGRGTGRRHYEFVLRGKYIQSSNRIVYPPQSKNPKGETHDDVGLFSFDGRRKALVLRQFHVEGFVNEYAGRPSPDGRTLVFESERIENIPDGWRARETYHLLGKDEFEEVFELAAPGNDYQLYSRSRWKRLRKSKS